MWRIFVTHNNGDECSSIGCCIIREMASSMELADSHSTGNTSSTTNSTSKLRSDSYCNRCVSSSSRIPDTRASWIGISERRWDTPITFVRECSSSSSHTGNLVTKLMIKLVVLSVAVSVGPCTGSGIEIIPVSVKSVLPWIHILTIIWPETDHKLLFNPFFLSLSPFSHSMSTQTRPWDIIPAGMATERRSIIITLSSRNSINISNYKWTPLITNNYPPPLRAVEFIFTEE